MIFHVPFAVEEVPRSGRAARVARMRRGFSDAGFDVRLVDGPSRVRAAAMRRATRRTAPDDDRPRFLYSEAATIPTGLMDPHHIPVRPFIDARFFRRLGSRGIPIGLFYPDVYWRFHEYAQQSRTRRAAYGIGYHFDLEWYRRYVDVLFVPSLEMGEFIPGIDRFRDVRALPPGCTVREIPWEPVPGRLRLLYVGSVTAPLYDVAPLVGAVRAVDGVTLTICCPRSERDTALRLVDGRDDVSIVHATGEALDPLYAAADVACLVFEPIEYRRFAMPVKLFEALGVGRPVLATAQTGAGRFVSDEGFGWSVDTTALTDTLRHLVSDHGEVEAMHAAARSSRHGHRWIDRAREAAEALGAAVPAAP